MKAEDIKRWDVAETVDGYTGLVDNIIKTDKDNVLIRLNDTHRPEWYHPKKIKGVLYNCNPFDKAEQKEAPMSNKVVYNRDFGGFGLSEEARKWLIDRGIVERYASLEWEKYALINSWAFHHIPRHDELLVHCVETLGGTAAGGEYADLAIKEVKGDGYFISDYDGNESVITEENFTIFNPKTKGEEEAVNE